VRIRIMNFSPNQGHSMHLHGHAYWLTGHEGGREPKSQWYSRTTEIILPGQGADLEIVANNPGDWGLHCHMALHMTNHLVPPMGPRIREGVDASHYKANLEDRPPVEFPPRDPGAAQPLYPTDRYRVNWTPEQMARLNAKREVRGMRVDWTQGPSGLFTILRVLPDDLFDQVMNGDRPVPPGSIFDEIRRRVEARHG
jgi:hypothetical protein